VRKNVSGFDQVMDNNLKSSDASSAGPKATGTKNSIQTKDTKTDIKTDDDREAMKAALKKSDTSGNAEVKDKTDAGGNQTKEVTNAEKSEDTGSKTMFEKLKAALMKAASTDAGTDEVPAEGQKKVLSKEDILEQILSLLQNVQEKVMDMLKLSPEELNSLLESEGLDI
jgi:hypothetical protein